MREARREDATWQQQMNPALDPTVLFGQLIGYGLSSTLALLLAVLAWQSTDEGRRARALNAACGATWSLGGLARYGLLAAGVPLQSSVLEWIGTVSFAAAAAWPVCLLLFWQAQADKSGRHKVARAWLTAASAAALALSLALVVATAWRPQQLDIVRDLVGYNGLAMMCGGALVLRPRIESRIERVALAMVLLGPLLSLSAHSLQGSPRLPQGWEVAPTLVAKQSLVLTLLGGLIYLGRFQASDRFAKLGLRVAFAWLLGVAVALLVEQHADGSPTLRTAFDSVRAAAVSAVISAAVLLAGRLVSASDRWVDRRIFGRRDPQLALADLGERLARQDTPAAVFEATEGFLGDMLNLDVRVRELPEAAPLEPGCPVQVGGREPFALTIGDGGRRRWLLGSEIEVVRQAAQRVGRRLEALEREREHLEQRQREARLVHQLVEAELRALRAQINPHFLFNSLNTIAALVHQDPAVAEAMTLRLARIFRYVLTQTDRPFSPLHEELDFLRAYLDIEQTRFGPRLQVEFRVDDAIAERPVPSLILQPLVENAIQHGLSPKIGDCRLVIAGDVADGELVLSVTDDGVGVPATSSQGRPGAGIGMRNVRERLSTVYGGRARLFFESHPRRGSRATVYLPLRADRPVHQEA